jgi:hypothetical protein
VNDFPILEGSLPSHFIEMLSKAIYQDWIQFESPEELELFIARAIIDNYFHLTRKQP